MPSFSSARPRRPRRFAAVIAACMALTVLSPALAAEHSLTPETEVSFVSYVLPNPVSMSVDAKADRAIVRAFLKNHPNYAIEPYTMPSIAGSGMDVGVLMGISAGNPPHAIYVNFRQSATYIDHGFLEPLEILLARLKSENPRVRMWDDEDNWLEDPTAEEIEHWREQIRKRAAAPVWPVIYREPPTKRPGRPQEKHVWAMPMNTLVRALLYRKDVFNRAGLDPSRPPETWEELLEYARKIKTLPSTYGMWFKGGEVISWSIYSFMVSNGVRYMQQNEDGEWIAAFNNRRAAEAIYFLARLINEPFTVDGKEYKGTCFVPQGAGREGNLKWRQGQIGMMFSYLDDDLMTDINPELVGIAPVPKSPHGTRGAELNCRMLGVFKQTTPAQKLAVMQYIWFITGDQAQEIRTRIYVANGYGKFVNPRLLKKFGYDDILRKVPPGWQETYDTALENGVPEPYGRNPQFIYKQVSAPINNALRDLPLTYLQPEMKEEALKQIEGWLAKAEDRVNQHTLGRLSDREWMIRRTVSWIVLAAVAAVFIYAMVSVWRAFGRAELQLLEKPSLWKYRKAYLMLVPALFVMLFFHYLPLVMGAPLAVMDYELVLEDSFVGIDNFATALFDARFWASLWRTFYWVILTVGLGFWPPIMVAILLDEVPTTPLKYIFRLVFYLPTVVSGVIMVFLWLQMYDSSEQGAFNRILLSFNGLGPVAATSLKLLALGVWLSLIGLLIAMVFYLRELHWPVRTAIALFAAGLLFATLWPLIEAYQGPGELAIRAGGLDPDKVTGWSAVWGQISNLVGRFQLKPLSWVKDPDMAMLCIVLPRVWAMAGPGCIIYLAALKTVPDELIEAASIDGAGILQKISYITLPRVKFLILIQLVGFIIGSFRGGVNFILAMTGGGPDGATRVLGMDIFERTFMELKYGTGAAMAWMLGGLVILLTAYQLKRISRAEFSRQQV